MPFAVRKSTFAIYRSSVALRRSSVALRRSSVALRRSSVALRGSRAHSGGRFARSAVELATSTVELAHAAAERSHVASERAHAASERRREYRARHDCGKRTQRCCCSMDIRQNFGDEAQVMDVRRLKAALGASGRTDARVDQTLAPHMTASEAASSWRAPPGSRACSSPAVGAVDHGFHGYHGSSAACGPRNLLRISGRPKNRVSF